MIYGSLMLSLEGDKITPSESDLLEKSVVGGVVLFSRNYQTPQQLAELVLSIRKIRPELLIAVDQEGGRVQRFRDNPFTVFLPMGKIGTLWQQNKKEAVAFVRETGWVMASELLSFGIDLNFAPVLDVNYGVSRVIGDRSFSSDVSCIVELASAFRYGANEAGMAAVGKHFPGHGGVKVDSHIGLPKDNRELSELNNDLQPFVQLINQGLESVMTAHVVYEKVDPLPATFSSYWLKDKLRKEFGFGGVVFSDCLSMGGAQAAGTMVERAEKSLTAGCDVILICNDQKSAREVALWMEQQGYKEPVNLSKVKADTASYPTWEYLDLSKRRISYQRMLQKILKG